MAALDRFSTTSPPGIRAPVRPPGWWPDLGRAQGSGEGRRGPSRPRTWGAVSSRLEALQRRHGTHPSAGGEPRPLGPKDKGHGHSLAGSGPGGAKK